MRVIRPNKIVVGEIKKRDVITRRVKTVISQLTSIDEKHIQFAKAERETGNLLACSMHPFVEAAHLAFAYHLPLVITPYSIWHMISSGVAQHINIHAEALRDKFVSHVGKKEISIRRDDFMPGYMNNPWHELIDEFSNQIRANTKNNVADLLVADFSSTSEVARVASQIVLMDAMHNYFDYDCCTECGIPEIRIVGEKKDWEKVRSKTAELIKLIPELQKWLDSGLADILNQFVDVFDDKIDTYFWNIIYKGMRFDYFCHLILIQINFYNCSV
jgi:hypothetical protein